MLYGNETWCLGENEMSILRRTERGMVRAMCGSKLMAKKRTEDGDVRIEGDSCSDSKGEWSEMVRACVEEGWWTRRVVYKSRQPAKFAGFSARFRRLLSLLHESKHSLNMSRRWTHNRLLFTKLRLLKNLKKTLDTFWEKRWSFKWGARGSQHGQRRCGKC